MTDLESTPETISLSDLFDGIYVINLPQSTDRRANLEKELRRHGLQEGSGKGEVRFIKAISPLDQDFTRLRKRHLDKKMRTRCFCVKKCLHAMRPLRETEIAICISHHRAYQSILEHEDQVALVLEDDVVLHSNISKILDRIINTEGFGFKLDSGRPTLAFCGGGNNPGLRISDPRRFRAHRSRTGFYSNYACILNKAAAHFLAKRSYPIQRPDDSFKRYWISRNKIEGYHIRPALFGELSAGVNLRSRFGRLSKSQQRMKQALVKGARKIGGGTGGKGVVVGGVEKTVMVRRDTRVWKTFPETRAVDLVRRGGRGQVDPNGQRRVHISELHKLRKPKGRRW